MPTPTDSLEPTPFDAKPFEPALSAEGNSTSNSRPANWVWPALGALFLLAALVIFVLPTLVAPTEEVAAVAPVSTSDTNTATADTQASANTNTENDTTPWLDAQAAKQRKEAQEVLAELLELQFSLDERGVKQWAATAFLEAAEAAANGDALYRERQYVAAKDQYQSSLTQLQALSQSIGQQLERQLEIATDNIEAGKPAIVNSALGLAAILKPESAELASLQNRAATLRPLIALLANAAVAEEAGELAAAERHLQDATELDGQHLRARSELQRVSQAHLQQRFNAAMSEGYLALDAGQFNSAKRQFKQAASLNVGVDEAASALLEVAGAEQASRLTKLKRQGEGLENGEQWQEAVTAYEQARAIDGDVLFATQGLDRSLNRARMDKQFRNAIAQPERLSDTAVAEATAVLLQMAKRISPQGPLLKQQIQSLETLLQQANTLVSVALRSDEKTDVVIYKVARLGRFQEQQLTLRPGTYRAKGSRVGYRDVLHSFTVSHRGLSSPVVITCTEAI